MKGLIFTYVLTYGGAVASIFSPLAGLLIYVAFSILMPPALWHWSVPIGNYSRIIGVAFLGGWALNGMGDGRFGAARPIAVNLCWYLGWVVASTFMSPDPSAGMPFVEFLAKIVLPFLAGVTLISSAERMRMLSWTMLVSCAYLAFECNMAYLGGLSIEAEGFRMLDNNTFSIFMVAGYGMAIVKAFEEEVLWRRLACFGMAAAMAHVPMLSFSRGGMLGILVASLAAVYLIEKSLRTWQMVAAAAVVGAVLAGPSVIDEFGTLFNKAEQRDASAQSRIDLWTDCVRAATTSPVFGIGQGRWQHVAANYGWPDGKAAHSLWFQTVAELGFPGVAILLLFYLRTIWISWRLIPYAETREQRTHAKMTIASLFGFAVSASFLSVDGFEFPFYVAMLGACNAKLIMQGAQKISWAYEERLPWEPQAGRGHAT